MLNELAERIQEDLALILPESLTEEKLEELLAEAILQLLNANPERLFASLYRLDVDERKVHTALANTEETPGNVAIARLIINIQKQKNYH